jgi:tetratricopeptide (TPR) repeat protein
LHHEREHEEEAEREYAKAIEVAPADRKALYYFIRARFHHQRDNYEKAEVDYTAAIQHEEKLPDEYHVDLLMHRALLYLDSRRFAEARTDYERVLFLNPDDKTRKQVMEWLEKTRSRSGSGVIPASATKIDSSATP